MNPTDDRGVHTHDFRLTGRCICGQSLLPDPVLTETKADSLHEWFLRIGTQLDKEDYEEGIAAIAATVVPPPPVAQVSDKWLSETEEWASAEYLAPDAIKYLQARLKRLLRERQMQETSGVVHMTIEPDMEKRAELFNEGFDTAHRQGIGGEASQGWLVGKLAPILDELRGELPDTQIDDLITSIADAVLDDSLIEDADSDTRPDQQRGMYGKYFVERLHDPTGRHASCRFFVLDPQHDLYALMALRHYATSAQPEFPKLSADLDNWISDIEGTREP